MPQKEEVPVKFSTVVVATAVLLALSPIAALAGGYSYLDIYEAWRAEDFTAGTFPCPSGGCGGTDPKLIDSYNQKELYGSHNGHTDMKYYISREYRASDNVSYNMGGGPFVPSAVSIVPGHSYSITRGYAKTGNLAMGAYAHTTSTAGNGFMTEAKSNPSISNSFTVLAGTSGKSTGDTVRLSLTFRFDGTLRAGGLCAPGYSSNWADIQSYLRIEGGPPVWYGEGYSIPTVFDFSADARLEGGSNNSPYWHPEYTYISSLDAGWGVSTNDNTSTNPDVRVSENRPDVQLTSGGDGSDSYTLDTHTLTRTFLAIIGEKYDISGNVWAYSTATGGAWSTVDFSNTLAGTIASSDGVLLAWDVAPSAVPVPPGLLLLAPGLAGLAVLRRRLRK